MKRAFATGVAAAGCRTVSQWPAMAAGAFALAACDQAFASDTYGIGEGFMIGLAMVALFACIVVVTCVVAWRRCRQHGRRGLWYLLVPVEVVVLTTLAMNLIDDMPWANGWGYAGVAVLALSLELLAWGSAHLLHHEPADTSRQTHDDR